MGSLLCAFAAWAYCVLIAPQADVRTFHKVAVVLPTLVLISISVFATTTPEREQDCCTSGEKPRGLAYFLCRAVELLCLFAAMLLLLSLNDRTILSADGTPLTTLTMPYWHSLLGGGLLLVEYLLAAATFVISYLRNWLWPKTPSKTLAQRWETLAQRWKLRR
ncbi:MAG: hypothetical protein MR006_03365 [Arcanobacterium sp.]|nr:hypothetical protein [Arcanobacterium sp.]MDY5589240.1 hypothetical protein [Arcanobacterium sp.]